MYFYLLTVQLEGVFCILHLLIDHLFMVWWYLLNILYLHLQSVQLIVVDLLLGVRTVVWEAESATDCDTLTVAPAHVLHGFQNDLALLRKLVQHLPVSSLSLISRFNFSGIAFSKYGKYLVIRRCI